MEPADAVRRRARDEPDRDQREDDAGAVAVRRAVRRRAPLPPAKVGYLMPWGSAAAALSADAMKQGIRIRSVGGAFTLNGRRYPIGTAFIRNSREPRRPQRPARGA